MPTTMKKQYHSNDQAKLKIVCDNLCDKIEELLDYFDLEYSYSGRLICMSCPILEGTINLP
jgi:hypothetical protein